MQHTRRCRRTALPGIVPVTLIVGILCENGVVMQRTPRPQWGLLVQDTPAAQRTVHKLTIHHDKIILGFSGFLGLAQRLTPTLEAGLQRIL